MRLLKVSPILVIILILIGYLVFLRFDNSKEINKDKPNKISYEPKESVSFKSFMEKNKISYDYELNNAFESISEGNIYSNKYFNFKVDLPDNWKIDRGTTEYTFIRATLEDSLKTITISGVSELNNKNSELIASEFQESPVKTFYELIGTGEDIKSYLLRNLNKSGIVKVKDLVVDDEDINSIRYVTHNYWYDIKQPQDTLEMVSFNFQTIKNNTTFTITYTCPNIPSDYKTIEKVINSIIIIN